MLGIGSYALILAVNRNAPEADVAAFGSFWALSFGLVGGVLLPFEQLMVRATAGTAADGAPGEGTADRIPVLTIVRLYVGVGTVLSMGLLLASGPLSDRLLGGQRDMAVVLSAYVVVALGQSYQRGRAAGAGRLDLYGRQLALDGGARLCISTVFLLTAGGSSLGAAVGVLAAGLVSLPFSRLGQTIPRTDGCRLRAVAKEALLLSSASTVSLWLLNAGPVMVVASGADDRAAAAFASVFVITRIPLLFQASLQAVVLASVASHHARADAEALRRSVVRSIALVAAAGIGIVVLFGLLADTWARLMYGSRFQLGQLAGTELALSTALFLVAAVCHMALVGVHATREASGAWIVSAIAFGALLLTLPGGPVSRVATAYVLSGALLLVMQLAALRLRLPSGGSLPRA